MIHPAILKAQDLNDRDGDLEPNEDALISDVNRINRRKSIAYGAAQSVYGDIPKMYRACLIRADEVALAELTAALKTYMQSLDYQDEVIAVRFAVAAE